MSVSVCECVNVCECVSADLLVNGCGTTSLVSVKAPRRNVCWLPPVDFVCTLNAGGTSVQVVHMAQPHIVGHINWPAISQSSSLVGPCKSSDSLENKFTLHYG